MLTCLKDYVLHQKNCQIKKIKIIKKINLNLVGIYYTQINLFSFDSIFCNTCGRGEWDKNPYLLIITRKKMKKKNYFTRNDSVY